MDVFLVSMLTFGVAFNDGGEAATVERLKQVGKVYVVWEGEGKDRHVARLDIRITGTKDARDVSRAMKELSKLPRLEGVMLLGPAFTDDAVKDLAGLKGLRDVQLHSTAVTDAGIEALADLPNLRRLAFWGSGLTDKGLKHVARMKELQYLEINDAPITDAGLDDLREMVKLRRLIIVNSQVPRPKLQRLLDALPELESRKIERPNI